MNTPTNSNSSPLGDRPHLDERATYTPRAKVESFIVPLLDRAIREALRNYASPNTDDLALDVGCGRQPFRRTLEQLGYTYIGLDTQQNQDRTVHHVAAIDQALPLDLAAKRFGLIFCTEVLEHVADWEAAFANFATLLRPGGRAIITCPHCYILHEEPYDFWRPTPYALKFFAHRHGLAVLHQDKLGSGFDVLGTQLAAFTPVPKPGAIPGLSHLAAGIMRLRRGIAFRILRTGLLQKLVHDKGPLYLSNLAVLEKP